MSIDMSQLPAGTDTMLVTLEDTKIYTNKFYIPNTGDYIVTFTLPNGDEYYGEFTVTD